jgi:hypothetical protein
MNDRWQWVWLGLGLAVLLVATWLPVWDDWSTDKLASGAWYLGLLALAQQWFRRP